jgi:hypothetical protein
MAPSSAIVITVDGEHL